jgi:hypothetical protein
LVKGLFGLSSEKTEIKKPGDPVNPVKVEGKE